MTVEITVNGKTYNDGPYNATGNPYGLANAGWRQNSNLINMLLDVLVDASAPLLDSSTTSLTVGLGSKVLTLQDNRPIPEGIDCYIISTADPTIRMFGPVTDHTGTSLTVNVTSKTGSGTIASWTVIPAGVQGEPGEGAPSEAAPPELADSASAQGAETTRYALEDHTHGHGNRGGGTLHAAATSSAAGFASANQIKLLEMMAGARTDIGTTGNAVAFTGYRVTSNITLTLPTMAAGELIIVGRDTTDGTVTIGRNSQTIDGVAEDFTINVNKVELEFYCTGTGAVVTKHRGNLPS